jgi:hypothetical protein
MKMFCMEDQEIDEDVLHRRSGQHGIAELEKTYSDSKLNRISIKGFNYY